MKRLDLVVVLLLIISTVSSITAVVQRGATATLRKQAATETTVNRIRFDHLLARVEALECAIPPEKLGRIGISC